MWTEEWRAAEEACGGRGGRARDGRDRLLRQRVGSLGSARGLLGGARPEMMGLEEHGGGRQLVARASRPTPPQRSAMALVALTVAAGLAHPWRRCSSLARRARHSGSAVRASTAMATAMHRSTTHRSLQA